MPERESMEYDVVIVGAGPSGLAAAIRLKQLAKQAEHPLSVCVVEKGAEVGAHILSGAVFEPRALAELFPDWRERGAPLTVQAREDRFLFLTEKRAFRLPTPPQMRNHGNYIISLGNLCRWLGQQAEELGVDIFPGFPAAGLLFDESGAVSGIVTADRGIDKHGQRTAQYMPGVELRARQVMVAEGCRGSVTRKLLARYRLDAQSDPQTYGIGLKEIWEIDPARHREGHIVHTVGWPLDRATYGGSFLYHAENNQIFLGFVIGLDYRNPHLDPFAEFQRFKHHPAIAPILAGGRRIAYGARALNEGGYQAIPRLAFPGGVLIGCAAGFLDVPKIKGSHTAMKSGMLAAESVFPLLRDQKAGREASEYDRHLRESWVGRDLHRSRNIRPGFHRGLWAGLAYAALDTYLLRGRAPWTLHHRPDHTQLGLAEDMPRISYPKPDGILSFDRASSVYISNTNHGEDQPCHLRLKSASVPLEINLKLYDAPEQRYCPAGVYEIIDGPEPRLQINAQNCVHCKTCDIKDPAQNIVWTVPEGGDGPNYPNM
ncbi:MAG TPA: electron transfer flavoprotein-ubiquinone oxidoreductase [Dongiaceae bacterium]|jgi:electron-transferring-flavoprotein dehydrogenase|nr:electron transfer flavoprotein-ubiquinone oxidoreductase [Dongiaceae bacterium]